MKIEHNTKELLTVGVIATVIIATLLAFSVSDLQVLAQEQDRVLVHINSGKPSNPDEVHAAFMAMSMATKLQAAGKDVAIFLDVNGVNLGVKNTDASLANATSLVQTFTSNGGKVYACEHCLSYAGFNEQDLADGVSITNPQKMSEIITGNLIVIDY